MFYSGCNYYINKGSNEYEPIGTATSMHDCECCDKVDMCLVKQENEVWPFNEEVKNKIDSDWLVMLSNG